VERDVAIIGSVSGHPESATEPEGIADKTPETDSLRIGLKLPSQLLNLTLPVFERNIM